MRMNHSSFDVVQVRVVFQCSLKETGLFAQLRNMRSIVVRKHIVAENGIGDLEEPNGTICFIARQSLLEVLASDSFPRGEFASVPDPLDCVSMRRVGTRCIAE